MSKAAISLSALRETVSRMPADSLSAARAAALEHIDTHGLPTSQVEDWKYTDLGPVVEISNRWLESDLVASSTTTSAAAQSVCQSIDAHWIVISNGIVDVDSVENARSAGVRIELLSQRATSTDLTIPLLNLNTALLRDGVHVRVDANTELKKPIGFLMFDDTEANSRVTQTRVEIELGANSNASFVEYFASSGVDEHYANSFVKLDVGDGATANIVRVQQRDLAHSQTGRLLVKLNKDSQFHYSGFDLGGKLVRNDLHVEIAGRGATAIFNGLYLAGNKQHIDNHTRVDHYVGPAQSIQEYRGILTDECQCVWNGKAIVHAGADGTDAQQQNHNLLLSEKSEIDAKPELEIYADDVKCSHGTTVGQLDEKAIFYLRSRGLSEWQAKQVLTRAFAGTIVNKIPDPSLRQVIAELVEDRLSTVVDQDVARDAE